MTSDNQPQQPAGAPPPAQDAELRKDLQATLGARRELGAAYEPELIDAFLRRLDQAIDARIEQRAGRRPPPPAVRPEPTRTLAIALALSIPLVAIAGGIAGTVGIVAVLVFIGVLIVSFARMRS